jgi:hypothetical protein
MWALKVLSNLMILILSFMFKNILAHPRSLYLLWGMFQFSNLKDFQKFIWQINYVHGNFKYLYGTYRRDKKKNFLLRMKQEKSSFKKTLEDVFVWNLHSYYWWLCSTIRIVIGCENDLYFLITKLIWKWSY